jgi:ligand-binding SRPBCC domain-containing protein
MNKEWSLAFDSTLTAAPADVWRVITTWRGVNDELSPLMRMTCPAEADDKSVADAETGVVLFRSWVLLLRWLPIDRHSLQLTRIDPGRGFLEESTSWSQAYWRHERSLEPTLAGGCRLSDRVRFRPRLSGFGPVVKWFIGKVFANRHRQLRRRFGDAEGR